MLLKEAGVPIPIPSDLLMISSGVQAASGAFPLLEFLVWLEVAVIAGSSFQFLVARGAGCGFIYRVGRYVGLGPERLDQAAGTLRDRGPAAVFVGLNLPGARAGIIAAAGLAGLRYPAFAPAMAAGSAVYYGWHIALGFIAGPAALSALEGVNVPVIPILFALLLIGAAGWLFLRSRGPAGRARSWTEAACPACLIATALQPSDLATGF